MESQNSIISPLPDPPLVEGIAQKSILPWCGNEILLDDLVIKHRALVMRHCHRRRLDLEDAEDVTQEVFIKVMHNLHRFENRYPFTTWLYRITVNAIIDHIRRTSRRMSHLATNRKEDGGEFDYPASQYDPENAHSFSELQEKIASILQQLPDYL